MMRSKNILWNLTNKSLHSYQFLLRAEHLEASEALELEGGVVVAVVVQGEVGIAVKPCVAFAALDHL